MFEDLIADGQYNRAAHDAIPEERAPLQDVATNENTSGNFISHDIDLVEEVATSSPSNGNDGTSKSSKRHKRSRGSQDSREKRDHAYKALDKMVAAMTQLSTSAPTPAPTPTLSINGVVEAFKDDLDEAMVLKVTDIFESPVKARMFFVVPSSYCTDILDNPVKLKVNISHNY
ncbi:hypothetical protein AMTR_s00054p00158130 [Amborella trichopoda]|uniref:Uncharacterized protein n=1 Tax=Amborella trichopoda TaxID=13333 RepID=U5CXV7_AMBTC|nr:hypothetical protein AMTR_s00054p00158130 [Amborella trichopoda]